MKFPQKTFKHRLIIGLCNLFIKVYNLLGLSKLFKYKCELDKKFDNELEDFSKADMKEFLEKRGEDFNQSIREQLLVTPVPLGNTGNNPPPLNELYPDQIKQWNK